MLKKLILVVDDNLVNCKLFQAVLGRLGFAVAIAEGGQQAVDFIMQGGQPDLVLMDIRMPTMGGYSATQLIRQWESKGGHARLPVVAVTANAFEADRQACIDAGMDDFLAKPIQFEKLKLMVDKWIPKSFVESAQD
jgi:CheY-like chemotaxis protein